MNKLIDLLRVEVPLFLISELCVAEKINRTILYCGVVFHLLLK